MDSIRSSRWTRSFALGILVVSAIVGNASPSASETVAIGSAPPTSVTAPAQTPDTAGLVLAHGEHLMALASQGSPGAPDVERGDGEIAAAAGSDDGGQLVPALYAWDPDVRFVFYRHVSKWM